MTILVTGADGQLGSSIKKLSEESTHKYIFTDKDSLDITDEGNIESVFQIYKPDCLINAAAYTLVDNAEKNLDTAYKINAVAPYLLSQYCKKYNCKFIHISTDYVFDGNSSVPYTPESPVNPKSVYGKTKLEGEQKVLQNNQDAIIVRTSWLYSEFGNNFVKTILRLGQTKENISVVYDQIGTPTYAFDLAKVLLKIAESNIKGKIFHFSDEGVCSWYDFAKKILEIKQLQCSITPILSKDYPTLAQRPSFSVLDKGEIKQALQITIPHWEDSLKDCLNLL